ncbi:MAG: ABC transporter ATP-binding protein [Clostridia bacterium]|nr:ABC transporter ATP-binding protein [Clostridia bacterium]
MRTSSIEKESRKGGFRRMVKLFTRIRVPWHLYALTVIFELVGTKVALLYVPYESELKLGNIEDPAIVWTYIGLLFASVAVGVIRAIPKFYAQYDVTKKLQTKLLSHSLRLPMKEYEKHSSRMVSWITKDTHSADGAIGVITSFITGIGAAIMTVGSMAMIDASLIWIAGIVLGYIIFDTWAEGRLLFLRQRADKRGQADMTAYLSEHLGQFYQVKQLHAEEEERRRGKSAIHKYYKVQVYTSTLTFIINLLSGSLTGFINIIIFVVGVPLVRSGAMDMSELVAFQTYVLIVYQSLSSLPSLYTSMMYYSGELFYISKLMDQKEEVYERKRSMDVPDQDIVFENVSFSYDEEAEKPTIDNASFTVPKGKVTAIVGPNGSGKSTVFKLISRLYSPDGGRIMFGDLEAEDIHLNEWRQSMTYVLQDPQLFDGTIRENIAYGMTRPVSDDEIKAAARLAYADEFIEEMPEGYDFMIGDNGSKLSAGQRQRLAIARAVMMDPAYLLLDEATCNIDVLSENEVTKALLALMKGRTTVMISHDMGALNKADDIIVINNGTVEASGPKEEVMEKSETLKKLIAANAGKAA